MLDFFHALSAIPDLLIGLAERPKTTIAVIFLGLFGAFCIFKFREKPLPQPKPIEVKEPEPERRIKRIGRFLM